MKILRVVLVLFIISAFAAMVMYSQEQQAGVEQFFSESCIYPA